MKKYVLVAGLGILNVSPAFAQSTVTLYGLIDGGVTYVSNQAGHSNTKFDDGVFTPNVFGFDGAEDLGGGTKAIFKLENQFQLGTGAMLQGGIFARTAYVGLEDAHWGKLTLGNIYDFMFTSLTQADTNPAVYGGGIYSLPAGPFQKLNIPQNPTGWFDWSRTSGVTLQNSVRYQSPVFAGISVGAMYSPGGVAGSFGSNAAMSFGLNYANGPLGLGAAYTEKKYPGSANNSPQIEIRNWGVGGKYAVGPFLASAELVTVKNVFNGASAYAAQVGANYLITPALALGGTYIYMKGNEVLDNNHAHQVGAILDYFLSKRTMVYVEGIYQRTNSGAQASIMGLVGPDASSSNANQAIARVGLHHAF